MYTVFSDSRENTTSEQEKKGRKCSTEVRLLWPFSQFGTRREEKERANCTDPSSGSDKNGIFG